MATDASAKNIATPSRRATATEPPQSGMRTARCAFTAPTRALSGLLRPGPHRDNRKLLVLHLLDQWSGDREEFQVDLGLVVGVQRQSFRRGRRGTKPLAVYVTHFPGSLDRSHGYAGEILHSAFDVKVSGRTNIHSRLHPRMHLSALDLDLDLVFEVAGEYSVASTKQHECDDGPRDYCFHWSPFYVGAAYTRWCGGPGDGVGQVIGTYAAHSIR